MKYTLKLAMSLLYITAWSCIFIVVVVVIITSKTRCDFIDDLI